MKTTVEILDAVRAARQLTSDYQLAALLETSTQRISNWRNGRHTMDNAMGVKVAGIIGREPLEIIAILEAERATTTELRKFWRTVAATAAAIFAAVGAVALDQDAPALLAVAQLAAVDTSTLCIMSNAILALLAALLVTFARQVFPCTVGTSPRDSAPAA